jgi:hypothetical protein
MKAKFFAKPISVTALLIKSTELSRRAPRANAPIGFNNTFNRASSFQ